MYSTNALMRCAVAMGGYGVTIVSSPRRKVAASKSPSAVTIVKSCAGARAGSTAECADRTSSMAGMPRRHTLAFTVRSRRSS